MATVLEFPTARQPLARPAGPMPGEVVLFPGVRFERRPPEAEGSEATHRDDGRHN